MADQRGRWTARSFRTYVEKVLVPTLRQGDIVIIDNLGGPRKSKAVAPAHPLPPAPSCSSCQITHTSLNPIQQVFSKLKHLLRKATARTMKTVTYTKMSQLLGAFTAPKYANYFKTEDMN